MNINISLNHILHISLKYSYTTFVEVSFNEFLFNKINKEMFIIAEWTFFFFIANYFQVIGS